ncbi:CoA-transferase family III [Tilletiaria anomala UBC 951]|uniref:CoA-transferase family III n=1 Tax=Tilletiaria anomala (strain ATCC 24038 / CBS 436.72 / UBC 951) TaxID=1037660 RepID=A0A066W0C4_TILAU|nr:CoA-transferase family III [Tilletiaria anomala UBC 951]KDN44240.1 CoA-transferase family III [Tilletiaria anomala UBC 951]
MAGVRAVGVAAATANQAAHLRPPLGNIIRTFRYRDSHSRSLVEHNLSPSSTRKRCRHDHARSATSPSCDTASTENALDLSSRQPPSIPPPLQGVKVVDLTRVLAGPYCTMLLADLGADVIKIEHPKGGDDTRAWGPPFAQPSSKSSLPPPPKGKEDYWASLPPESAYFLSVNRSKRSITVDLKSREGLAIIKRLVQQADVVVENYLPGKLASMGMGYEQMKGWKHDIIYASITGYGQTGPFSPSAGYDVVIAADAGLFHITGEADRPPVKIGVAMTDLTTGLYVHGAIMAALIGRSKTGQGVHIDASLFESQIASLANIASNYLIAGQEAGRHGTSHPSIVPYQVFPTKDGFLMVGAGNDGQFKLLASLLGRPDLAADSRYSTNIARVAHRDGLIALLSSLLQQHTSADWLAQINGRIPAAPIRNIAQTFAHPQARARGVVTQVDHPRAGRIKIASPAVQYGESKMPVTRPPPVLGQHTDEVLAELAYSEDEVRALRQAGAIGR